MPHCINLVNITKIYGTTTVLDNINLYIDKNEFVTLLGPSGCGKTTTLRILGGFETPTAGQLLFNGEDVLKIPPHKRKVNTVFQKYALFPNMNVEENIAFGPTIRKNTKTDIAQKVDRMLKLVNLEGYNKRMVTSLSGGQQQRVAIARALINEPEVLLLDEPLGALDLQLRKEMQLELKNMQQKLGITFVYVTHDQDEALSMSDTIAVMESGRILQIGKPEDIYNEPKNAFVAKFIGESNLLPGIMREDFLVEFSGRVFKCIDAGFGRDEPVEVVIRPEDIALISRASSRAFFIEETPAEGSLKGRVKNATFKGVHYEMLVEAGDFTWKVHSTALSPVGEEVALDIKPDLIHVMKRQELRKEQ